MNSPLSSRIFKGGLLKDRRSGKRDRRLLEGTMKYRGEYMDIEIVDLSERGAYVVAPRMPELSDLVTITIGLPGQGGSIMISGRVRRVALSSRTLARPGGFGVEFTRFYSTVGRTELRQHLFF